VFKSQLINGIDGYEYCESHDQSDIILVCNVWGANGCRSSLAEVITSDVCSAYIDKIVVYNDFDNPIPNFCGAYTSINSVAYSGMPAVSVPYLNLPLHPYPDRVPNLQDRIGLVYYAGNSGPQWSPGHRLRMRLSSMLADSEYLVAETANQWSGNKGISPDSTYVNNLLNHRIVLCPRGVGNSSYRIYESILAGAVPLILADDWVRPHCIDRNAVLQWSERSLSVLKPFLKHSLANLQRRQASLLVARKILYDEESRCRTILNQITDIHQRHSKRPLSRVKKKDVITVKALKVVLAIKIMTTATLV
jgi:hypothetical protein